MTRSAEPVLVLDAPVAERFEVGQGNYQLVSGKVHWAGHVIASMRLNQPEPCEYEMELFPSEEPGSTSFFIRLQWLPQDIGKHLDLSIEIFDRGSQSISVVLGPVNVISSRERPLETAKSFQDEPLIVICMATYAPQIERFEAQLESILCQSYQNWQLIICDDAAPDYDLGAVRALCAIDPRRIQLYRHDKNLGFYHNFERALSYVPAHAEYIALSDQDDRWYPDKLEKLLHKVREEDAQLVYSDMRIVHDSGKIVADSYWLGRKNEYLDFDTVFLANTVTGAASLFKAELLETLVPFPARIGDAFHDHWIACCALTKGKVVYVDEPLYDYMQYGDSVIGHCDFLRWTPMQRLKSVFSLVRRFLHPKQAKQWLGQKLGGGMAIYRGECLRLKLIADTLKLRLPAEANRSTLNLMNGGFLSALKLLKVHLKILSTGRTTDDAEFRLAMGFIAREYQKRRQKH